MDAIQSILSQWKEELLIPNQKDVLVQLIPDKNALEVSPDAVLDQEKIQLEGSPLLKKLVKKSQDHFKESGIHTLGIAHTLIVFEFEGKQYQTPVLIDTCVPTFNRIKKVFELKLAGDTFFNPFLNKLLQLDIETIALEEALDVLRSEGLQFQIKPAFFVGNFHPHRFVLLKEISEMLDVEGLEKQLGHLLTGVKEKSDSLELHEGFLFPADQDQRSVFNSATNENLVVQGPPGTGKSQVIGNLLAKALGNQKSALLVAEKQVALSVIYELFKTKGLHHFCLLHHHQLKAKDFIASLKDTWQYLEQYTDEVPRTIRHADLLTAQLQLSLDRLREDELIGGLRFSDFKERWSEQKSNDELKRLTAAIDSFPSVVDWEKEVVYLKKLNKRPDTNAWCYYKIPDSIESTEKSFQQLAEVTKILENGDTQKWTVLDLHHQMQEAALAHHFFFEGNLLPKNIVISSSKLQKEFFRLYNDFQHKTELLNHLAEEKNNWKKEFNISELTDYINALASTNRFNLRERWKRKELLKYSALDFKAAKQSLEHLVEIKQLEKELIVIRKELKELELPTDLTSLAYLEMLIKRVKSEDKSRMKELAQLDGKQLKAKVDYSNQLSQVYDWIKRNLALNDRQEIYPIIKALTEEKSFILRNFELLGAVSNASKKVLLAAKDFDEATQVIYHYHWDVFCGRYPELATYDGEALTQKVTQILDQEAAEQYLFSKEITAHIKSKFEAYEQLLQTPARKLDESQKALKKQLRKGKSILVKAFAKSRNLPTPLELFSSEAALWIAVLKPVVLASPYTLAKSFPLKKNSFDLVVFDEASQIPLPHAVGGVYRAKRVVVAGDRQQMTPQFYFKSGNRDAIDLLHQASYYFESTALHHHYRSVHPRLIAFSNAHFYENNLIAFPAYPTENPIEVIDADGCYENRINKKEAEIVADLITEKVNQNNFDFGVVAFSQTQLNAILDRLSETVLDQLMNREEQLLIQSLENVQGEQCDHLIISLGYGYNPEHKFNFQFGPLNQVNGHRRLNVLFSRARKKITFVRSVAAKDFTISDNIGVDLLRKWMLLIEQEDKKTSLSFPFALEPKQNSNKLVFNNIQEHITNARTLLTLTSVLNARGWEVGFSV